MDTEDMTTKNRCMQRLRGVLIRRIEISGDQTILAFTTGGGGVIACETAASCCSESWWADVLGVGVLRDATVRTVERISMEGYDVDDGRGRQDEDQAYGYKITTDRGDATLVFRNSSNGFYGGYVVPRDLRVRPLPPGMIEIVEDWHA